LRYCDASCEQDYPAGTPGILREYSGGIPGVFRRCFEGTPRVQVGIFWGHPGDTPGVPRGYCGGPPGCHGVLPGSRGVHPGLPRMYHTAIPWYRRGALPVFRGHSRCILGGFREGYPGISLWCTPWCAPRGCLRAPVLDSRCPPDAYPWELRGNSWTKTQHFTIAKHRKHRNTIRCGTQCRAPPKAGLLLVLRFFNIPMNFCELA
jgi:hypothetical protein